MPPFLRLLSDSASPVTEVARWLLDYRGLAYEEEARVTSTPSLIVAEGALTGLREIAQYLEARSREDVRLVPAWNRDGVAVMFEELQHFGRAVEQRRQVDIDRTFDRVEALLADGRQYLGGDRFTLADLAFAAFAHPVAHGTRPAVALARRLWNEHRGKRAAFIESADLPATRAIAPVLRPILGALGRKVPPSLAGARCEHEGVMPDVLDPGDAGMLRTQVAGRAAELIDAALPLRRIDVVGSYARLVAARTVAIHFGVPGPAEPTLLRWLRSTFHDTCFSRRRDADGTAVSVAARTELAAYVDALIAHREDHPGNDDVLTRLVQTERAEGRVDGDAVRRKIIDLIADVVDATSTIVAIALDELVENQRQLAEIRAAAIAGDIDHVRNCVYKAAAPNLGDAMHAHFSTGVATIQIPELVAAIVRLPGLRRARGNSGRITWQGPFAERLVLTFDA